eukprot:1564254-Pyramimonas_sp.AAC.1
MSSTWKPQNYNKLPPYLVCVIGNKGKHDAVRPSNRRAIRRSSSCCTSGHMPTNKGLLKMRCSPTID